MLVWTLGLREIGHLKKKIRLFIHKWAFVRGMVCCSGWKNFLTNNENKEQLIDVMYRVWSEEEFRQKMDERNVILIKQGEAFKLTSNEVTPIPSLRSNQEETDSRVVLYSIFATSSGYSNVKVKTPDSDLFWILLHHSRQINVPVFFDTGHGNKKRLINITELGSHYSENLCDALLGLHAFSGCDTVSAFKGKGKIKPMKLLLKSPSFCQVLAQLGEQWDVTDELISGMKKCVCAVYGGKKNKITKVGELRHFLIKSKCEESISASTIKNIDLSTLPPSKACLEQHIRRANYQTRIWKLAKRENGEPLWCDEDQISPPMFVDVLDENNEELENEENTDEDTDLIYSEIDNDMVDIEEDEDDDPDWHV